jgi:hypothetical protein
MGSQPQVEQGRPPGEPATEEEESLREAAPTLIAALVVTIVGLIFIAYFGGWFAHVLTDIAVSGWNSK